MKQFCNSDMQITKSIHDHPLRRADHSSRGVLPTVVRRCVWSGSLVKEEALAHWNCFAQKKKKKKTHDHRCLHFPHNTFGLRWEKSQYILWYWITSVSIHREQGYKIIKRRDISKNFRVVDTLFLLRRTACSYRLSQADKQRLLTLEIRVLPWWQQRVRQIKLNSKCPFCEMLFISQDPRISINPSLSH